MNLWKGIFHLLIIYALLFTGFFLTSEAGNIGLPFHDVIGLLTSGLLITFITLAFFLRVKKRHRENITMLTMAAFGLKVFLYMVLIFIFYFLSKIEGVKFIITFFIIYLSFTFYLIRFIIKSLNQIKPKF